MLGDLLLWAQRRGAGVEVELACADDANAASGVAARAVVRLEGCLADLPDSLVPELLVLGVARVWLRTEGCARRAEAEARVESWRELLDLVGRGGGVATAARGASRRRVLEAGSLPTASRRGLLGLRVERTEAAPLPDPAASGFARTRSALRALADGDPPSVNSESWSSETGTFGAVSALQRSEFTVGPDGPGLALVAEGCVAAGVCVRSCPEGALASELVAGEFRLLFDAGVCSGCGACLMVCDAGALSSAGGVPWSRALVDGTAQIASTRTVPCVRCRTPFVDRAGRGLCPPCAYRREHPFGSILATPPVA